MGYMKGYYHGRIEMTELILNDLHKPLEPGSIDILIEKYENELKRLKGLLE